ncbi:Efflux pump [Colletotrichum fructicola]|uniref:Efflux pump aflT n=2 Tax=Colletotrichum gloeosporioides species complex TaxID=2707338 RepID=L2GGE1_COLFN|nr:Efflux pump [Colletotrichum fructicola]KAF4480594.1 Efflux pump aflT [Colletotrichum fructicola Nara gc5]KAI8279678.1 Efflux pump aflT [Colletotrichum sp. SAR11_57]KAE9578289.1 Efflux pump [Colletotrichum fructicola]KAF4426492.1 Efflux pump aflT [Colletotrichum fructicola]KAF4895549.1 Efflux pump aflT [Colletotrichum fructicola]
MASDHQVQTSEVPLQDVDKDSGRPEKEAIPNDQSDKELDGTTESGSDDPEPEYATGLGLVCIVAGLTLAVFCLSLDRTILATAIPTITTEFKSLGDVAWYGTSFPLATCCFQLMFGKLFAELRVTWVFLAALGIFEVGSIVCGAAPNSLALIIGRAISGIGCAGMLSGVFIIIALSFPVQKRPIYTGMIGGMAGIAEIIGPTIGGALTDNASWRWCFWINLPLGAVTAVMVMLFVKPPKKTGETKAIGPLLKSMDPLGNALLMPLMVCFLLALQWGGTVYAWSNWRIILCLCLFGVLLIVWLYVQYRRGDEATLPVRLMRQRSVASGTLFMLGTNGTVFVIVYYVSFWFQAVKDVTAQQSGINFLASSLSVSVSAIASGFLVSKIGYWVPQMVSSTVLLSVACGLIYRYNLETSTAYWAGTLVMFGLGVGQGMQMPLSAVQTVLKGADIALGTSVLLLAQTSAGIIMLAVAQNLFQSTLLKELTNKVQQVDAKVIIDHGAYGLKSMVTEKYGAEAATAVLKAYNEALRSTFLLSIVLACLTFLACLGTEWRSVKEQTKKTEEVEEAK